MIALVTRAQAKPGAEIAEEGRRLWQDELLPALQQLKGFVGATVLAPNQNANTQSVVLWETAEDAQASMQNSEIQGIAAKFGPLVSAAPVTELHNVTLDKRD